MKLLTRKQKIVKKANEKVDRLNERIITFLFYLAGGLIIITLLPYLT